MDVLLCQCNSNIQQFALEPLGFKSKLPEQVTKLCLFRHFVFLRDSLLIYPKSKVQLTFFTFSSLRWFVIPLNLAQSWKHYTLLFIILRFHLTTTTLIIIINITNPLATIVLLLTVVILVILCFCSNNTIVLTTLRLYLAITSHTRNQWKVPWRSAGQWRVTQFK